MRQKNNSHQQDIDDLKRQNTMLEAQSLCLLIVYLIRYMFSIRIRHITLCFS